MSFFFLRFNIVNISGLIFFTIVYLLPASISRSTVFYVPLLPLGPRYCLRYYSLLLATDAIVSYLIRVQSA